MSAPLGIRRGHQKATFLPAFPTALRQRGFSDRLLEPAPPQSSSDPDPYDVTAYRARFVARDSQPGSSSGVKPGAPAACCQNPTGHCPEHLSGMKLVPTAETIPGTAPPTGFPGQPGW